MKLVLKNQQLTILIGILDKVQPRNMPANRGRAKLFAKVQKKLEEYVRDETDILTTYCQQDEAGTGFIPKEGENLEDINKLLQELHEEEVVIKGGEYSKRYMDFLNWLAGAEDEFTSEEAVVIDAILEQFEGGQV